MFFNLIPKEVNFFDLFEKQVGYSVDAAEYFKKLVTKDRVDEEDIRKIQAIEHQGDEVAHDIIERLNKTFITPFDREDIHALAKQVDDVTDIINTIISRINIYKLNPNDKHLVEFASVIMESVNAVACAVKGLRDMKNSKTILEACVEINRLENVGDSMRDKVLVELFEKEKNPINVIKWKEVYQDAETALDICEDVTHVVGAILMKQA